MRTLPLLLLMATALSGAFAGCQVTPRGPDGTVIQDDQWPALLAQRENQPATVWRGSGSGTIEATSPGWGAGWAEYTQARKAWQAWWQQHGEETLLAAYPDLPSARPTLPTTGQ
jgi:hypothetical protein